MFRVRVSFGVRVRVRVRIRDRIRVRVRVRVRVGVRVRVRVTEKKSILDRQNKREGACIPADVLLQILGYIVSTD